jgi:alpha-beta hydrolase superfamily lysophospholipase
MSEYTDHHAPEGLLTRGTVVVVPGRGESRAAYGRFGRRLAADAYRVRVVDGPEIDADDLHGSLARFGDRLAAAVAGTAASGGGGAAPLVLVGADSGAAAVAALSGPGGPPADVRPDAVVLAGLPGRTGGNGGYGGSWDDELDVRTSCPTHRGVLSDDPEAQRGALGTPLPGALLDAAYQADLAVPALLLVGDADPLADRDALTRTAKTLSRSRLAVVRDAHHDVLNDLQHRSVAAEVVTFLEALRTGLVPAIAVESSAW